MGLLRLVQLPVEQIHALLDLSNLLDQPVVNWIATELNIRPVAPGLQTTLRHLLRRQREPK